MTSADAATFPDALYIIGAGCLYFDFTDPTYSSPPAGTTLFSAGDAVAKPDCASCPCDCTDVPDTFYIELIDTSSWDWLSATPCSPSITRFPVTRETPGGCVWVSTDTLCIGGGVLAPTIGDPNSVRVVSIGSLLLVGFKDDSGNVSTFSRSQTSLCDVFGQVPWSGSSGAATPPAYVTLVPV